MGGMGEAHEARGCWEEVKAEGIDQPHGSAKGNQDPHGWRHRASVSGDPHSPVGREGASLFHMQTLGRGGHTYG